MELPSPAAVWPAALQPAPAAWPGDAGQCWSRAAPPAAAAAAAADATPAAVTASLMAPSMLDFFRRGGPGGLQHAHAAGGAEGRMRRAGQRPAGPPAPQELPPASAGQARTVRNLPGRSPRPCQRCAVAACCCVLLSFFCPRSFSWPRCWLLFVMAAAASSHGSCLCCQ